ncbi:MAG: septal ring lytic transglycosylase RlpA family protein [Calditrichaeota bacterium]|nr:MAG: septal ring lytic transglycosylase RlpA family protein [Calditrichota bacterium]
MILTDLEVSSEERIAEIFTETVPEPVSPSPSPTSPQSSSGSSSSTEKKVSEKPEPVKETESPPSSVEAVEIQYGKASYYADKFHGRPTASGEPYDRNKLTAAHRTLPFGTRCRVTNLANGKSVIVRVNDRGPHVESRVIDLSYRAAKEIGLIQAGIADVKVEVLPN